MTQVTEPDTTVRLIATDLDGTLLGADGALSPRTVAALAAAEQAGIHVVFVTGRPARWMGAVSEYVHRHGVAICGNGAAVVDLRNDNELIKVSALETKKALTIVDALRTSAPGVSFAVERTTGIHHDPHYPPLHLEMALEVAPVEKLLDDGIGYEGRPILKLLAHHGELAPDDFLTLGRQVAGQHGQFTRSSASALLEISGTGVSKASTLAWHCAELGISPQEVVAFGDMPNDLEMLGWAGTAYAMANAHPSVLAACSRHALSHEEDGVATVIEGLLG